MSYYDYIHAMGKHLFIIVPGSKTKLSPLSFLNVWLRKFYAVYGVETDNDDTWPEELASLIPKECWEVKIFEWSGGVSPLSVRKAVADLVSLLDKNDHDKIVILGKSLGGIIAKVAATKRPSKVTRIIFVATPHFFSASRLPQCIEMINVYSPDDRYLGLANNILCLGRGRVEVPGAVNICLPGIQHSQFNRNIKVQFADAQSLFGLYKSLVLESLPIFADQSVASTDHEKRENHTRGARPFPSTARGSCYW